MDDNVENVNVKSIGTDEGAMYGNVLGVRERSKCDVGGDMFTQVWLRVLPNLNHNENFGNILNKKEKKKKEKDEKKRRQRQAI